MKKLHQKLPLYFDDGRGSGASTAKLSDPPPTAPAAGSATAELLSDKTAALLIKLLQKLPLYFDDGRGSAVSTEKLSDPPPTATAAGCATAELLSCLAA